MDNKIVLAFAAFALIIFSGVFYFKNNSKTIPYYVQAQPAQALKSIHFEPPHLDQMKKDLTGKNIIINKDSQHIFINEELESMKVLHTNPVTDNSITVDVQISSDLTLVQRKGFTKTYTRENLQGSLRLHYERRDNAWFCNAIQTIDLHKDLTPNSKSPPKMVK